MKKILIVGLAGFATAVGAAACAPTVSAAGDARVDSFPASASLCQPGEQPLFQCQAGARTIALCGGGAGANRYVQYRYGRPGAVELAYPARGMAGIWRAQIPYSGGGETQVNFRNGATTYSLYSRTVRTGFEPGGTNNPAFSAGVEVRQGGRKIADRVCTSPSDAQFEAAAYDLLPEGEAVMDD